MKAYVALKKKDLRLIEVEKPRISREDEVLVKIKGSGICGSDGIFFDDKVDLEWIKYPVIIGHEFAGIVDKTGKDVSNVKTGDHVVIDNYISCGHCIYCKKGNYFLCNSHGEYGYTFNGGFAEYAVINKNNLVKIPDSIDFKYAAITENVATALRACKMSDFNFGDTGLVVGNGPLGTLIALIMKSLGMEVTMAARGLNRIERVRKMGFSEVLNSSEVDIRKWTKNNIIESGFDIIIDTSGSIEPTLYSSQIIKKTGKIILMGITGKKKAEFDYDDTVLKEVKIMGCVSGMGYFEEAVKFIQSGLIDLDKVITHTFKLDDVAKAFKYERERIEGAIKVIILQ